MYRRTAVLSCLVFCTASAALGQPLTLEGALQRARESAPLVLSARARIEEARARLVDASQRFREQPVLEGAVGPRRGSGASSLDADLGIEQIFETGGQRSARMTAAQAGVDRETAAADDALRRHLRDVVHAYVSAAGAGERYDLARRTHELASELLRVTERRFTAGDIPAMDLNLSRIALARAEAEMADAQADLQLFTGALRRLIGLPPEATVSVAATLAELVRRFQPVGAISLDQRPELRILNAERREAEADLSLGQAMRRPDVGGRFSYEREEGDHVALFGFSVRLPFVDRGAPLRASATARSRRLELELQAVRQAIAVDADTARRVYEHHLIGANAMEKRALPAIADNDTLALKSYEAGQIGLLDLLLLQREALEIRQAHLDHLLGAAIAGAELATATGGVQ